MASEQPRRVIEVEAERLPEAGEGGEGSSRPGGTARKGRIQPLAAGVVIDLLNLATRGPRGMLLGLALGLGVGYYLGRRLGLERSRSLGLGSLCGIYCALPGTELLPLATLIGAYRTLRG